MVRIPKIMATVTGTLPKESEPAPPWEAPACFPSMGSPPVVAGLTMMVSADGAVVVLVICDEAEFDLPVVGEVVILAEAEAGRVELSDGSAGVGPSVVDEVDDVSVAPSVKDLSVELEAEVNVLDVSEAVVETVEVGGSIAVVDVPREGAVVVATVDVEEATVTAEVDVVVAPPSSNDKAATSLAKERSSETP